MKLQVKLYIIFIFILFHVTIAMMVFKLTIKIAAKM